MDTEPLIHIGYAKAGSTWLQQAFSKEDSGFYFPYFRKHGKFTKPIVFPHPFEFDPEARREEIEELIRPGMEVPQVPVISSERLAGHWFSGGYDSRLIADRLHQLFPSGNILIVIREQKSMIKSVYRQYVKKGGGRSIEEFLFPPSSGRGRGPGFSFTLFKYNKIIRYYNELYSPDNVLAIPLEVLKEDTARFFDTVVEFADASPESNFSPHSERANVGIDAFDASIRRRINPLIKRDFVNDYSIWYHDIYSAILARALGLTTTIAPRSMKDHYDRKLEGRIDELVGDRFRASNRQTDQLVEFDLEQLGWEL